MQCLQWDPSSEAYHCRSNAQCAISKRTQKKNRQRKRAKERRIPKMLPTTEADPVKSAQSTTTPVSKSTLPIPIRTVTEYANQKSPAGTPTTKNSQCDTPNPTSPTHRPPESCQHVAITPSPATLSLTTTLKAVAAPNLAVDAHALLGHAAAPPAPPRKTTAVRNAAAPIPLAATPPSSPPKTNTNRSPPYDPQAAAEAAASLPEARSNRAATQKL